MNSTVIRRYSLKFNRYRNIKKKMMNKKRAIFKNVSLT